MLSQPLPARTNDAHYLADLQRAANFLGLFWRPGEVSFIGHCDHRWTPLPNGDKPIPATPFDNPVAAAAQCMQWRARNNTFFTHMVFNEPTYIGTDQYGRPKVKGFRKAVNAKGSRALVADIDCGPGKLYPDRAAILEAIAKHLPDFSPSLIMASGGGVHLYWLLDDLVFIEQWKQLARALANMFEHCKLCVDRACTVNPACWLRPNRTYNLKTGAPRLVEAIQQPLHIYRVADVEAFLGPYMPSKRRRASIAPTDVNDPLLPTELAHMGALGTVDDRYYWIAALHSIMRSCGYDGAKALLLADALSRTGAGYEGTEDVDGRLDGIKGIEDSSRSVRPTLETVRLWGRNNALKIAHTQAIADVGKVSAQFAGVSLDQSRLDAGLGQPKTTVWTAHATPLNAQRALYYLLRWWPSELEGLALPAFRPFRDEMHRLRAAYWTHERQSPFIALTALEREALDLVARDPAMAFDLAHWLIAWLAGLGWSGDVLVIAGRAMRLDEADARCWAQKNTSLAARNEASKDG